VYCDERLVVIRFANYLIINVYLPCFGTKERAFICDIVLAHITSWCESFAGCKIIVVGDMNVNLDSCDMMANNFAKHCCLRRCDDIFPGNSFGKKRYTYVNEALGKQSYIDYMLTSCIDDTADFNVLDPDINYSDHLPLFTRITNIVLDNKNIVMVSQIEVSSQKYLRWDHADLAGYYASTGTSLSIILK